MDKKHSMWDDIEYNSSGIFNHMHQHQHVETTYYCGINMMVDTNNFSLSICWYYLPCPIVCLLFEVLPTQMQWKNTVHSGDKCNLLSAILFPYIDFDINNRCGWNTTWTKRHSLKNKRSFTWPQSQGCIFKEPDRSFRLAYYLSRPFIVSE